MECRDHIRKTALCEDNHKGRAFQLFSIPKGNQKVLETFVAVVLTYLSFTNRAAQRHTPTFEILHVVHQYASMNPSTFFNKMYTISR